MTGVVEFLPCRWFFISEVVLCCSQTLIITKIQNDLLISDWSFPLHPQIEKKKGDNFPDINATHSAVLWCLTVVFNAV